MILFDINQKMCQKWREENLERVATIICGDFIKANFTAPAIVTAGNSYGIMSGGIDLVMRKYFGIEMQDRIQWRILHTYGNKGLPVGESIALQTGDNKFPTLIYAPTMERPSKVAVETAYSVFFNLLCKYGTEIACPGLCTTTGGVSEEECAMQMSRALSDYYKGYRNNSTSKKFEKIIVNKESVLESLRATGIKITEGSEELKITDTEGRVVILPEDFNIFE